MTPWLDLAHAEAAWVLRAGGVDALVIKGPTLTTWLYPDNARNYGDVDILVDPTQHPHAAALLADRGYRRLQDGVDGVESPDYTVELEAPVDLGRVQVDLHRYFPGIELPPERAWSALWSHGEPFTIAHVDV